MNKYPYESNSEPSWQSCLFSVCEWLDPLGALTISQHPAERQRTCDRSSSLVRSWLMARDCVECDYVACCSTDTGDCILITLFRDVSCSLLYKRGKKKEKEKRVAGCAVYLYWRKYPSKLPLGSEVFISECQLHDFLWIARKMLLGGNSSYGAEYSLSGTLADIKSNK